MSRWSKGVVATLVLLTANGWSATALPAKPSCGDGERKGGEECDGADLGGATCGSLGYVGGTLACTGSCTYDTSACGPAPTGSCGNGTVDGFEECDGTDDGACPGLCSAHCACPGMGPGDLELHFIDVGQGDAILVISPDGFTALVDAGEATESATVDAYLAAQGVLDLDYTVASHLHADHIGGLDAALGSHPEVVASFDSGGSYASTQFDQYDAIAGERRTTVGAGDTIDMGPSMQVDVLHGGVGSANENNNSVVLRLSYGDQTILLGGDCESGCENSFDPGPIDVYKVHHHGSSDSSGEGFLDLMSPTAAVISVGTGNDFGHPDPATLSRLAVRGIDVLRTDLDGDVVLVSNGSGHALSGAIGCTTGQVEACGSDVGECAAGQRECSDGVWGACTGAVGPVAEQCANGLDDDCDGWVDGDDPDCGGTGTTVVIAQVGYDTPGDDATEEFIDLFNATDAPILLDGWTLSDNTASWPLPASTSIPAGGYLSLARDAAVFEALYGVEPDLGGLTLSLSNSGDVLVLTQGADEIDRVAWEGFELGWSIEALTGDSIERGDPALDTDDVSDWSVTSPASPRGGTVVGPGGGGCGNGTCDPGEDCLGCAADCPGVVGGKPADRWCCGNGTCEPHGEDAASCAIDCGA